MSDAKITVHQAGKLFAENTGKSVHTGMRKVMSLAADGDIQIEKRGHIRYVHIESVKKMISNELDKSK